MSSSENTILWDLRNLSKSLKKFDSGKSFKVLFSNVEPSLITTCSIDSINIYDYNSDKEILFSHNSFLFNDFEILKMDNNNKDSYTFDIACVTNNNLLQIWSPSSNCLIK